MYCEIVFQVGQEDKTGINHNGNKFFMLQQTIYTSIYLNNQVTQRNQVTLKVFTCTVSNLVTVNLCIYAAGQEADFFTTPNLIFGSLILTV